MFEFSKMSLYRILSSGLKYWCDTSGSCLGRDSLSFKDLWSVFSFNNFVISFLFVTIDWPS